MANRKLQKNEEIGKFFTEYLSTNIDDMDFEDVIIKDNRNFCEFSLKLWKRGNNCKYIYSIWSFKSKNYENNVIYS